MVRVTVQATVTFDAPTQMYTYSYTVKSQSDSGQEVDAFALDFAAPISSLANPPGWTDGFFHDRSTIEWAATVVAPHHDVAPDDGGVPPGIAQIKPGASLGGFSFKSPKSPGPVPFYVTGYVQLASYASELEAELAAEQCREVSDFFKVAVAGATLGPVDLVPVEIDLKPGESPNGLNPRAEGVLPVALLGTATFDVASVDPGSLRFGPSQAKEIHNTAHNEDVNGDGRPDLVLHFRTLQTGLRCNDTAGFLVGRTTSGQEFRGADSFVPVACPWSQAAGSTSGAQ